MKKLKASSPIMYQGQQVAKFARNTLAHNKECYSADRAKELSEVLTSLQSLLALLTLMIITISLFTFSHFYQKQHNSNISLNLKINSYVPAYFDLSKLRSDKIGIHSTQINHYNRNILAKYQFIYSKIRNNKKISSIDAKKIARAVLNTSTKTGLDPLFLASIIFAESGFRTKAQSPVGALGLMQLMPSTAKYISRKIGDKHPHRSILFNPEDNIRLGAAYLLYLSKMYQGDLNKILVAYNWGPANVELAFNRRVKNVPTVTKKYVSKIKDTLHSWQKDFATRKVAFQYAGVYQDL